MEIIEPFEEWLKRHHQTTAAEAAATTQPSQPEEPMTTPASPFDGIRHFIDDAENVGIEALAHVKAILTNPVTAAALPTIAKLAGLGIDPQRLTQYLGILEAVATDYGPQQGTQQAPAQP